MTTLRPWRDVAIPHADVLEGSFQQAEFAADITAVRTGKAADIYQDAAAFFGRTFITEGMRLLLSQAARRVARTLFLGSAPASVAVTQNARGLDPSRVLLGCLQPEQSPALFTDALTRLADRLHYLNTTGDRESASVSY